MEDVLQSRFVLMDRGGRPPILRSLLSGRTPDGAVCPNITGRLRVTATRGSPSGCKANTSGAKMTPRKEVWSRWQFLPREHLEKRHSPCWLAQINHRVSASFSTDLIAISQKDRYFKGLDGKTVSFPEPVQSVSVTHRCIDFG